MMKILLISLLFLAQTVFSETMILKDGTVHKGKLLGHSEDSVRYFYKGKEVIQPKSKMYRIIYAKSPEIEARQTQEEAAKAKADKDRQRTKEEEESEIRQVNDDVLKAIEEQLRQERLNASFEERIKKLEDELALQKGIPTKSDMNSSKIKTAEEDAKELKKRMRRVENFLEIDPDLDAYNNNPRNMMSVVWRSALIPGWGLNYAKSNFGNIYMTAFLVTGLAAVFWNENLKAMEKDLKNKAFNDFLVQPITAQSVVEATASTGTPSYLTDSFTQLQSSNLTTKLIKYNQSKQDYEVQKQRGQSLLGIAAGIYAVQLLHSALEGYFWAKKTAPGKFDEKKTGFNWNITPTRTVYGQNWNFDLKYEWEF